MMSSSTAKVTLPSVEVGSSIILVLDVLLLVTAFASSVLKSPSSDWEGWLRDSHLAELLSVTTNSVDWLTNLAQWVGTWPVLKNGTVVKSSS